MFQTCDPYSCKRLAREKIINKREHTIALSVQDQERILDIIDDEPHISTTNVFRQTTIWQSSVHRVIGLLSTAPTSYLKSAKNAIRRFS